MVKHQIEARGITSPRLLDAMRRLPRSAFAGRSADAYQDHPVSIGSGQTMSQPYMIALMIDRLELRGHERVLEIGTGSGYQTGLLAMLAGEVYTVERVGSLAMRSRGILVDLGFPNIVFREGDGSLGWPEEAPFDGILVSAAAPRVPPSLVSQLADNGKLVVPVAEDARYQVLTVVTRIGNRIETRRDIPCRFVPLLGREGFAIE